MVDCVGAIYRESGDRDVAVVFPTGWFKAWAIYSRDKGYNIWLDDGSDYLSDYGESEPLSKGLMVW